MKKIAFYEVLLLAMAFLGSCGKDTCNEKMGATFQRIEADTVYQDTANKLQILLQTDALETLPESYFSDFVLLTGSTDMYNNPWQNSWQLLDTITVSKQRIIAILKSEFLPEKNEVLPLSIHLRFEDRKNYIDCMHPGSSDSYYLDLDIELKNTDGHQFTIHDFFWNETLTLGGF